MDKYLNNPTTAPQQRKYNENGFKIMFKQLKRQLNLFRNLRNPQIYLGCKYGLLRRNTYFFKLRRGVMAEVPARLLQTFKESVLGQDYIQGFPRAIVRRFDKFTVLDVGANAGYFSLWWLSRFIGSRVIAIEPMPNNFSLLARNQTLNASKDFQVANNAMSNQAGKLTLHYDRGDSYTTSATVSTRDRLRDEISVNTISLGKIMANFSLKQIDFLKLDCEGSEYDILYDCEVPVLESVRHIAMETHRSSKSSFCADGMCDFLRSKQFKVSHKPGSDMVYAWR